MTTVNNRHTSAMEKSIADANTDIGNTADRLKQESSGKGVVEYLIASPQRDALITIFEKLTIPGINLELAIQELQSLPEVTDYDLKD